MGVCFSKFRMFSEYDAFLIIWTWFSTSSMSLITNLRLVGSDNQWRTKVGPVVDSPLGADFTRMRQNSSFSLLKNFFSVLLNDEIGEVRKRRTQRRRT